MAAECFKPVVAVKGPPDLACSCLKLLQTFERTTPGHSSRPFQRAAALQELIRAFGRTKSIQPAQIHGATPDSRTHTNQIFPPTGRKKKKTTKKKKNNIK